MGCGGSKTEEPPSPRNVPKNSGRGTSSRAQSRKSGTVKGTPRHTRDSPSGDAGQDRKPPKGMRRHSIQTKQTEVSIADYYAPTAYEKEDINLEGNWEVEQGVDTTTAISDTSYPQPNRWKPVSERINFVSIDYEIMTNIDLNQACGPFDQVATNLTKDYGSDIQKVRALVTWMSCQKIRTRTYGPEAQPDTVVGYMKLIKELKGTYAGLLANLCRSIHIPCIIIRGIYKSSHHQVGEDDLKTYRSTWNAVYVDGGWQLVHPYLVCTPLATQSPPGDWKLLQNSRPDVSVPPGHVLNTFFFAPNPENFIFCCLPDEIQSYWQLLETRFRYQAFLKQPFLRPAFFMNNMQLKSKHDNVLIVENGMCLLRIKCDAENIKNIEFMYELYTLDKEMENKEEWGFLVFAGRSEDTWFIQVKFPVEGTFKLVVYGQMCDWFFWLCDFKIVCSKPMANFVPSPMIPKEVGWGPSQVSVAAGLIDASHECGVIFFKPGEEHVIRFLTMEKVRLRCQLENAEVDTEELEQYVKVSCRRTEADIIVNLPTSGEFVLIIYHLDENEQEKHICNYLFADWDDGRKRENVFQRRARSNVRTAALGYNSDAMDQALSKFREVKLDEEDDDYIRGNKRHKYLALKKKLRDAEMRRHEQTLYDAIHDAETSPFQQSLQPNITRCQDILDTLQQLDMHCHPVRELDHVTIAEIANYVNPPHDVHKTMIATYLLLGEDKVSLQRWGYIQALLRRQGREGLKARIAQFSQEPQVDNATLHATKKVFNTILEKYILSASLSATTVFHWVAGTLACLQNTSQNAVYSTYDDMDDVLLSIKDEEDGDETLSQDEGFLDSNDTQGSITQDSGGNTHGSSTHDSGGNMHGSSTHDSGGNTQGSITQDSGGNTHGSSTHDSGGNMHGSSTHDSGGNTHGSITQDSGGSRRST